MGKNKKRKERRNTKFNIMNELTIIQKKGIVTTSDLFKQLEKGIRSIIKQCNSLAEYGMIAIIECRKNTTYNGTRRYYMKNEIYKNCFKKTSTKKR